MFSQALCVSTGGNVIQQVAGGKPIQLSGKPVAHAKGQLVQLGGKGQQTLGLIQTPQGTINIIPQAGTAGGVVTIAQPKTQGKLGFPSVNDLMLLKCEISGCVHEYIGKHLFTLQTQKNLT